VRGLEFEHLIDVVLKYHMDHCRHMHIEGDADKRSVYFNKAEAAREILVLVSLELAEADQKRFRQQMAERLNAMHEAMFFDRSIIGK